MEIQAIKSLGDLKTARGHPLFPQDHARGAKKWTYSNWLQEGGKTGEERGKKGRPRTCLLYFKITMSVKQEFPISSPLFNNKQSQSLTSKSKWYCDKCQSRRREKRQIARSKIPSQFLVFFSSSVFALVPRGFATRPSRALSNYCDLREK